MLVRSRDVEFFDEVINDPSVRHAYVWPGELSLGEYIESPDTLAFKTENGGFLLKEVLPNMYDIHVMFRRPARPEDVLKATRTVLDTMFDEFGAAAIHAAIAEGNWVTKKLAKRMRFQVMGVKLQPFNGKVCEVTHYGLSREMWRPN